VSDERFRSWLFSPADVPERCRKAYRSAADQVIWDLEDGVAPEHKDEARERVLELLAEVAGEERRPWVRINAPSTERGREDLERLAAATPRGRRRWVIPKADAQTFAMLAPWREGAEWLFIVETATGLLDLLVAPPTDWRAAEVRLSFGALDYQLDIGGSTSPDELELLVPRTLLSWVSRRLGFGQPVDVVFPDVPDEEGLKASAGRARRLGFGGKLLIHPRQVPVVHSAFLPTEEERRWAEAILAGMPAGVGAALVDGVMVDRPVLERARSIVAAFQDEERGSRSGA
jgi:citrate lyase subunit beta/citryl-CoA lyase